MGICEDEHHSIPENEDRRRFLKTAGATAAGGAVALSLPAGTALARERAGAFSKLDAGSSWRKVRQAFALDRKSVYMNVGTTGSMPRQVLENYNRYNRIVARDPWAMGGEWGSWPYLHEIVDAMAPQFGADPDEIVLSRNTTDGMCSILGGLKFEPGDEIVTTHHEHVAATSPLWVLAQRSQVTLRVIDIPVQTRDQTVTEDAIVDSFRNAVTPQTRLIVFSHVTYKTGTRLPAKRICQEVAIPNRIPTLIDGAHTPGMIDLDFHDIDCDFYAGSGHKWQCGPGGTGILYVRKNNERLRDFWMDRAANGAEVFWPVASSLAQYVPFMGLSTAMQYAGQDNYPAKRALGDVCEMWRRIGRDRIENYVLGLSRRCKREIGRAFGDQGTMFSPGSRSLSSGLTAFNPFTDVTDKTRITEFRDRLQDEYGYIVRTTDFKVASSDAVSSNALRISTHLFHNGRQVSGLVEAMYDLYRKMDR